jgi:hypothetical protein
MGTITILDVTDPATFGRIPPCADPGFDHRSCDYWEDADRGSKAARLSWLEPVSATSADSPATEADEPVPSLTWRPRRRSPIRSRPRGQPTRS